MISRWGFKASLVLCAITAAAALGQDAQDESAAAGRRHALLIGCTVYPELTAKYQLYGPGNDVTLTTQLLREKFGYADEEIVTLIHDNDAALQPTYDNIFREFAALIDRVAEGDSVFVLLAGHGSQQKNDDPDSAADQEHDGLDEVFLPQDITEWKYNKPVVKAIRDDQIRAWLDAIRAKGALVFFVADTCHSGTMDRGRSSTDETFYRERYVPPVLINGPVEGEGGAAPAETALDDSNSSGGVAEVTAATEDMGGLIALYAVDDATQEREHPMPPESRLDGPAYGRLSYALSWVLNHSKRPLTYRELAQQIRWQYQAWRWDDVGFLMGSAEELDREVLGNGSWADRSGILLSRDSIGRLSIDVGLLHGATVGSEYLVYPPVGAEDDDQPVGCVRVVEATPTAARVETCSYGDEVAEVPAANLPVPGRCELVYAAYGSLKMSVAVAPLGQQSPERLAPVETAVRAIADQRGTLIEMAAEGATPDAYVLVGSNGVYLRHAYDTSAGVGGETPDAAEYPPGAFGPFAPEGFQGSKLEQALRAMAKANNVRELATSAGKMVIGDVYAPDVELKLVVERWDVHARRYEPVNTLEDLELYDRDKVRVQVFNLGGAPVDVTILYIESAFRIRSYFPTWVQSASQGFNNRITEDSAPATAEFTINDSTTGLEDVVVIATLAEPGTTPQNFVFLEQAGLKRSPAKMSPLEQLATLAAFGVGERGGMSAADIGKYVVRRVSWTVLGQD
jgi:hypothetical protein